MAQLHVQLLFKHAVRGLQLGFASRVADRAQKGKVRRDTHRQNTGQQAQLRGGWRNIKQSVMNKAHCQCLRQREEQKDEPLPHGELVARLAEAGRREPDHQAVDWQIKAKERRYDLLEWKPGFRL